MNPQTPSVSEINDWLRNAARGDGTAAGALVHWIEPDLANWIRKYRSEAVRDMLSTMDIAQESLTRLFRSLPTLQAADHETFRKILYRIVRNHLVSEHRRITAESRGRRRLDRFTDITIEIGFVDANQATPSQEYSKVRDRALVRVAESLLSPRNQELVLRRIRMNQTWLEIASAMGLDPDAARVACGRAVEKMTTIITKLDRGAHAELCQEAESDDAQRNTAFELYRVAYERRRDELGDSHPDTLASRHNLAVFLREEGFLAESMQQFKAVLSARRTHLGDAHPDTLASMNNLAAFVESLGQLGDAEAMFREALAGFRSLRKPDDMATLLAMRGLALNILAQAEYPSSIHDANRTKLDEADQLLQCALDRCVARFGHEHTNTKSIASDLDEFHRRRRRIDALARPDEDFPTKPREVE